MFSFPSRRLRSRTPLTFQFILPELTLRWGGLFLAWTRSTVRRTLSCLNSLNGEKDFLWPKLAQRREGLFLAWTRSTTRRSFSGALTCPGCTSPPPWMHWGLFLFLACTRSRARRSFNLSRLHSLEGKEVFFFSCLQTHESAEVFSHHWCLRSPKDDEDFKTLTDAANRRKTMGTLKL